MLTCCNAGNSNQTVKGENSQDEPETVVRKDTLGLGQRQNRGTTSQTPRLLDQLDHFLQMRKYKVGCIS